MLANALIAQLKNKWDGSIPHSLGGNTSYVPVGTSNVAKTEKKKL